MGGSSGVGGTAGVGGTGGQPADYTLTISQPSNGATVQGLVTVSGRASGFLNVEVWDATHQNPPLGRATPAGGGAFSLTVDTRSRGNGPATWTVRAWDSPPGQPFTRDATSTLSLTIQNGGTTIPDAGVPPGPTGFVMGAENKDGPLSTFEAETRCDVNLIQLSTGWCSTWSNWEADGCGRFSEARSFTQADSKHAVELSLAPWPQSLSGQSWGACARGEYDGHYTKIAQSMVSFGLQNVIIRLGYEWDGNWFPWGTGLHETGNVNNRGRGGTAIEYGQCFKRFDSVIQGVARGAGAKFLTVMNPIHDTFRTKASQLQQVFDTAGGRRKAGGSVDFIAVDLYDYPARGDFDASMQASIAFAKRNSIPLSVPEWGVGGDSRAQPSVDDNGVNYINKMADYFRNSANGILYASYFSCARPECSGNHSLTSPNNPKSRAAFINQFGNGKLGCGANARAMVQGL